MRVGRAAGWVAVLLSAVGPMAGAASAAPAQTIRVDVSTGGVAANAAPDDAGIAMSANGTLIAFASPASNLVPGDTNGMRDVFVRNLRTGKTTRIDLGAGGVQANGDSFGPLAMSGDGRFVAFESDSSNLASGSGCSPGQAPDCLFVRDRLHGTTRVVKRIPNPGILALSQHGRYLVAAGLVTPLERIDLRTNTAVVVSCCGLGSDLRNLQFDGMSANANLVAFSLNAGPTDPLHPDLSQVYVRNIARHTTTLVSRNRAGMPGDGNSIGGAMSPGGRYVFFTSAATDLVPGDTNRHTDVFVRDRRRGTTRRIDLSLHGQANGDAFALGISAGGRYRLYQSQATNIVPGDTNHAADLFLRDRRTRRTVRVDRTSTGGQANHGVGEVGGIGVAMTPGARWVAFVSPSTNLVAPATAGAHVYRRGPLP
jgi:hypothetical protein